MVFAIWLNMVLAPLIVISGFVSLCGGWSENDFCREQDLDGWINSLDVAGSAMLYLVLDVSLIISWFNGLSLLTSALPLGEASLFKTNMILIIVNLVAVTGFTIPMLLSRAISAVKLSSLRLS